MKKVTVVIPNWNGLKFLKACLDSLTDQDTEDYDILVIDNASTDDSVDYILKNYPDVRVDVMTENLGFSGGVNEGIRRCNSPYVLLLNNDVEVDRSFVRMMTQAMDRHPKAFSISSRMVKFYEREKLDDAGDLYNILGWGAQRGLDQSVEDPKYLRGARVFSACAGAAIYRKSVFEEIGLFDLSHFAYLEDIDVGYRAMIYGYQNLYEPSAIVYHVGSGTTGSKYNDFKVRISARNNIYLTYKNMPAFQRGLNFLPLWLGRFLKKRFFKKLGYLESYEAGIQEGYEKRKGLKKVPFTWKHFPNYVVIEGMLIKNLFIYLSEYLRRHRK